MDDAKERREKIAKARYHAMQMDDHKANLRKQRTENHADEKSRMADGEEVNLPYDKSGAMKEHQHPYWNKK